MNYSNLMFLGYFQILNIPKSKEKIDRYKELIGKVCKLYKYKGIDDLIVDVKGVINNKSEIGLFYFPKIETTSYFNDDFTVINENILRFISFNKYKNYNEYKNYEDNTKIMYIIKGYHPEDSEKRMYYFKSSIKIKESTKITVDTKFGKQHLIVTDCKAILKDQEKEYLEKFKLGKFRKVLGVFEEVEIVKKEIKERPIE